MIKVKIRDNLRYFESDDSDFEIQAGQVKELPEKLLRSYSIKNALFNHRFLVVEGEIVFTFKNSLVYLSKDICYGKEYGKFYKKDIEFNSIEWVDKIDVPKFVLLALGETIEVPKEMKEAQEQVKSLLKEIKTPVVETVKSESKEESKQMSKTKK